MAADRPPGTEQPDPPESLAALGAGLHDQRPTTSYGISDTPPENLAWLHEQDPALPHVTADERRFGKQADDALADAQDHEPDPERRSLADLGRAAYGRSPLPGDAGYDDSVAALGAAIYRR